MKRNVTKLKATYSEFNQYTKAIIKTTLVIYCCLIITAIYSHFTSTFELLILQDDILHSARSTITTGIMGAVLLEYINKK